jgi:3-methylcrotonyl-CoA carboxylase alpha subunit
VDSGVGEGDAISPHYDSMIAKLIVWGETAPRPWPGWTPALARTHIVGLHTNVAFLRRVVASHGLRHRRPGHRADRARARGAVRRRRRWRWNVPPPAWWRASWRSKPRSRTPTPGHAARRLAPARRRAPPLRPGVAGTRHAVALQRLHDGALTLVCRSASSAGPQRRAAGADRHDLQLGDRRWTLTVYAQGERMAVFAPEGTLSLQEVDAIAHAGEGAAEGRPPDRADAGQGDRLPGPAGRRGQGAARRWP